MRHTQLPLLVGSLLLVVSSVSAQTTAPSAAPAASASGGPSWLWIILVLAVVGAAVWYFGFRNRSSTTSSIGIDHDRVAGSAKQAGGSIKEGAGGMLGDTKLQAEGKLDKAEGAVQNAAGSVKDTLRGR